MANEIRLIDANALLKAIESEYDLNYGERLHDPIQFAYMVEDAPTVDAVPVVPICEKGAGIMVVDIGVVKNHIKPKADSTLFNMRKADLIEYVRCLEHNYNVAVSFNENQAKYIESLDVVKVPQKADRCNWCEPSNELCGTCTRFFLKDCSAMYDDEQCVCYSPIDHCPKCGRKLGGG